MRPLILALLLFTLGCASAAGQPTLPLQAFEGNWRGQGRFRGAPSEVSATFAPLYLEAAWTLDVDVRFIASDASPARFQGRASYSMRNGELHNGVWIDSVGNSYVISPRFEGGALIVDWGNEQLRGRSEYRLQPNGRLQIEDFAQAADGGWRRFANAVLERESRH